MGRKKFILDPRFGRVMRKIERAMRPWGWCLIGGRAVEVWTNPPQTPDVDILAAAGDDAAPEMLRRFSRRGIPPKGGAVEGLGAPTLFLHDRALKIEVDVLGAYDPLHFSMIERAPRKSVQGVVFPVAFAEDIVILKAQSATDPGRPAAKRARDRKAIRDVASAVRLDRKYLCGTLERQPNGWRDALGLLKLMRICP